MSLSPEAQALFDQYANSGAKAPEPQQQLDGNHSTRMREYLTRNGMSIEQAENSAKAQTDALRFQMAEKAHYARPVNEGINGRSGGLGRSGIRTGRSLAELARGPVQTPEE